MPPSLLNCTDAQLVQQSRLLLFWYNVKEPPLNRRPTCSVRFLPDLTMEVTAAHFRRWPRTISLAT